MSKINLIDSPELYSFYREAADRIWEMAKEYDEMGLFELSSALKDICTQMHDYARSEEVVLPKTKPKDEN